MNIGKVSLSILASSTFQKKRTTYGLGPKTKQKERQGIKSARQGMFNRLHDTVSSLPCHWTKKIHPPIIYPCLADFFFVVVLFCFVFFFFVV